MTGRSREFASLRISLRVAAIAPIPCRPFDEWGELTVTTDAKGVATLTFYPGTMMPLSIRVAGPGVAPHTLPLDGRRGRTLSSSWAAPDEWSGSSARHPASRWPTSRWRSGSRGRASGRAISADPRASRRITPDEILRLDPRPLKTGPQGTFQTPPTLLSGSTYRVSIRQDGFVPFVSDWVTLDGERATIPPIRLQPLQKLTGQIKDRQGRAVAGARVFLPAGGPATTTDAEGRFALAGINPGKAVILVEQTGFRLQGWLVDPSSQAEMGSLTLVRTSEAPEPVMKPLADPIPPEESRALADRLLEPYLHDPMENDE